MIETSNFQPTDLQIATIQMIRALLSLDKESRRQDLARNDQPIIERVLQVSLPLQSGKSTLCQYLQRCPMLLNTHRVIHLCLIADTARRFNATWLDLRNLRGRSETIYLFDEGFNYPRKKLLELYDLLYSNGSQLVIIGTNK